MVLLRGSWPEASGIFRKRVPNSAILSLLAENEASNQPALGSDQSDLAFPAPVIVAPDPPATPRPKRSVPSASVAARMRANQLWGFQRLFSPLARWKVQLNLRSSGKNKKEKKETGTRGPCIPKTLKLGYIMAHLPI